MSVQAMTWVFDHSEATGSCRLVLLAIANRADVDGSNAWPNVDTLARDARVDRATVFRAIKALEDAGAIIVEHGVGGPAEKRANYRPNRYTVVMPQGSQSATRDDPGVASRPSRGRISSPQGSQDATRTVLEQSRTADAPPPPEGRPSFTDDELEERRARVKALRAGHLHRDEARDA